MEVATKLGCVEVGVRDLKNNLSRYIEQVRAGQEVIVTDRGHPVARLTAVDEATSALAGLVAAGLVRPPTTKVRSRPARRVRSAGSVSDLVVDQRR